MAAGDSGREKVEEIDAKYGKMTIIYNKSAELHVSHATLCAAKCQSNCFPACQHSVTTHPDTIPTPPVKRTSNSAQFAFIALATKETNTTKKKKKKNNRILHRPPSSHNNQHPPSSASPGVERVVPSLSLTLIRVVRVRLMERAPFVAVVLLATFSFTLLGVVRVRLME